MLIESIKHHEGFRGLPYNDHLGFPTIGYGTKLPLDKEEATLLLEHRLNKMLNHLSREKPLYSYLPVKVQHILAEMAYQMGVDGLLKFKKTWEYISEHNYRTASTEMLNSKWAKQTPERAIKLSKRMYECQ